MAVMFAHDSPFTPSTSNEIFRAPVDSPLRGTVAMIFAIFTYTAKEKGL